jgi:hypothetical protein
MLRRLLDKLASNRAHHAGLKSRIVDTMLARLRKKSAVRCLGDKFIPQRVHGDIPTLQFIKQIGFKQVARTSIKLRRAAVCAYTSQFR